MDVMQLDGSHNQAKSNHSDFCRDWDRNEYTQCIKTGKAAEKNYDVVNGKGSVSLKNPQKSGVG